jgi:hypothetical protein
VRHQEDLVDPVVVEELSLFGQRADDPRRGAVLPSVKVLEHGLPSNLSTLERARVIVDDEVRDFSVLAATLTSALSVSV